MFIGRQTELALLSAEFALPRPSLIVVYGRRRVGKSTLLQNAARGLPHVFYQAARIAPSLNIEAFKGEIARSLGADAVLSGLRDWLSVLHYLAQAAERRPGLAVILDEFPYLTAMDGSLPSILQKFWDSGAPRAGRLKLVLCGSLISHMEELLAERNPLYGRKTMAMEVAPLPIRDAAQFFPRYAPATQLMAYAIFGGVPFYLQLCDPEASLAENVIRLILTSTGPLVDEPTVLLQSELRDIQRYASILAAVAGGCTKHGEIIGRVKEINDSKALGPYIEKLERMRLIRVVKSLDASPKERDRRYFISDPLVAFWHRFVRANLSSVTQGFGAAVWRRQIEPRLDAFMGPVFEEICRDHARRHSQERLPAPAQEIGQIWGADYDIDVAGRLLDDSALYGECKWTRDKLGEEVLDRLIGRAALSRYGRDARERHFLLYSRSGFTDAVRKRARTDKKIVLHTLAAMLAAKTPPSRIPASRRRPPKTASKQG
jgi:AAA+ ATPase superfamily predicted ATPase